MGVPHLADHEYKPKERAAAKEAGEIRYFTGRPCKYSHVTERIVANGNCVECSRLKCLKRNKQRLIKDPDWYKKGYAKNPEKYRLASAKYRLNNPEKVKDTIRKSAAKRKPQHAASEQARQAKKLQATPKWLTPEQFRQMESIYIFASKTSSNAGFKCHVDHIVPLQGKNVCGLHVPWNLRVVSAYYNMHKKNKLDDGVLYQPSMSGVLIHNSALPWNWRKANEC